MSNYICADLKRILFRLPRIILTLLVYAVFAAVVAYTYYAQWSSINFVTNVQLYIEFLPILLGLVELIAVFADDFRAKTMQVAIGLGISRAKVVYSKLIEVVVLAAIDLAVLAVIILGVASYLEAGLSPAQSKELLIGLTMAGVTTISYISVTMILMFYNQSTGLGRILYLLLSAGMVSAVVSLIGVIEFLEPLNIESHTMSHYLSVTRARWIVGIFDVKAVIACLIYIAASTAITIFLFKKSELEF